MAVAVVGLLAVLTAAVVTGYGGATQAVTGLIVGGEVVGEEQADGTVHVSQEDLPENESYTITAEDGDVCVGNCPQSDSEGDPP